MIFIVILILVTIAIASSAAYFSVYGLAHLFTGAVIPVIIMGSAIEAGKLVAASFLYRYWNRIGMILKSFLLTSVVVVMLVTSVGIFGFLTSAYQQDTLPLLEMQQRIELLEIEKKELTDRRSDIDSQIQNISANMVRSKERLSRSFNTERSAIEDRLAEINPELSKLKTDQINVKAKVGPIMLIAEVLDKDPNRAVFWFILILIFVFDPLAIALTICVNIAIKYYKDDKKKEEDDAKEAQRLIREQRKKAREDARRRENGDLPNMTNTDPETLARYIDKKIKESSQTVNSPT